MTLSSVHNKTIAITGASGFIGKNAIRFFQLNGCKIISLSRFDISKGAIYVQKKIETANIVINLAGAPILKRWTEAYKKVIANSRIDTTRTLVEAIGLMTNPPELLISTSAVGIYNTTEIHDEFSEHYDDSFLANVCQRWENEALQILSKRTTRLVIFRLGVVLGRNGGAFPRMALPFRFFVGGTIGKGDQWFPFIHIRDVLSAIWFVCTNQETKGIYNLIAPQNISNKKFSKELSRALNRPCWLPVPKFVLKLIFGEGSSVLTEGQYVKAHRLAHDGFMFEFPSIEKALIDLTSFINKKESI